MKIGIILFLSNYYHKISTNDVNKLKYLLFPLFVMTIPFLLVVTQPDLGTAILIFFSGAIITWLAGVRWKIFAYLTGLLIILAPIAISFLKPYQKSMPGCVIQNAARKTQNNHSKSWFDPSHSLELDNQVTH